MKLPPRQAKMLRRVRQLPLNNYLNLAPRTAPLRTARALERKGLVVIIPDRYIGGFNVYACLVTPCTN